MSILISILPLGLYFIMLKLFDSFAVTKWLHFVACFVYGALAAALMLGLCRFFDWNSDAVSPVIEEVLKSSIIIWLIARKKIYFLPETLIYGAASGSGFAFLENIMYLIGNPDMMIGTAIFRGFGIAIMHMGCAAFTGAVTLLFYRKKRDLIFFWLYLVPSIIIHYSHNLSLFDPTIHLVFTLVMFLVLFMVLFSYGEKRIYDWMDHSISVDVQTLSAIRQGTFSSTKEGQYLMAVKKQFAPEVFFDIICYVELYLEIKIEKQSQMLMQQAGFAIESSKETTAKEKEMASLYKSIGKTAHWVIQPLIRNS
ncbi:MAG: PrsW family intramembrane metalloprotease [Prevotellaceae bacterium]|nr:PrsW family intramembrane metalloprotease [Candidatus Colivivens equi]MCQ2075421.1 PrsW family intramembrane metalloprotease [Bacteroidaceae bacterium]